MMGLLGKYFITKLMKQFEKMAEDLNDIKTKIAVHEALRATERGNSEELKEQRELLILLDSKVKALWRREDAKSIDRG